MGEDGVEVLRRAQVCFDHTELHEIADVVDKTSGELGGSSGAGAGAADAGGVEFADASGVDGELPRQSAALAIG